MAEPTGTMTYKYFYVLPRAPKPGRQRNAYAIVNRSAGEVIGSIDWHAQWRQYVFEARENTIWSVGCLNDVAAFMATLK